MKTKNLVLCAVCAAITCVLAPIAIPLSGMVPLSLATFATLLAGILLGGRLGALSQLVYLLIGAVGVPVFAGYTGGFEKLVGPTGGYLIGYIPMAFLAGTIYTLLGRKRRFGVRKVAAMLLGMIAGELVLYLFGTTWYCIYTGTLTPAGIVSALSMCVLPFLIGDAAKIALVTAIAPALESAVGKIGFTPADKIAKS